MYFDLKLWSMTRGLRGRVALAVLLGLAALGFGIVRFAFLGVFLSRVFAGASFAQLAAPFAATALSIMLRVSLDDARIRIANRTATHVQEQLRLKLFDKIIALGPAWFGAERTGGVMLSMVDGVEQLQTFFGQYLPQVCVAACAPLAIFAFMAWWDVPCAAILLAAALFTLIGPLVMSRRNERASKERQAAMQTCGRKSQKNV